jgi:hypothetical protein
VLTYFLAVSKNWEVFPPAEADYPPPDPNNILKLLLTWELMAKLQQTKQMGSNEAIL